MSHNKPDRRPLGAPGSSSTGVSLDIQPQASKKENDPHTAIYKSGFSTSQHQPQLEYTSLDTCSHKVKPSRKKRRFASRQQFQSDHDQSDLQRGSQTTSDSPETVYYGASHTTPVPDKLVSDAGDKVINREGPEGRRFPHIPATEMKGPEPICASHTSELQRQLIPKGNAQDHISAGEVKEKLQKSLAGAGHSRGTVSNRKRLVDLLGATVPSKKTRLTDSASISAESKSSYNPGTAPETLCAKSSENADDLGNIDAGNARESATPMLSRLRGSRVTYARQRSFLGDQLKMAAAEHGDASVPSPDPSEARQALITDRNAPRTSNTDDDEIDSRPVRSIHELRQAGDNARFRESVESIFEDIEDSNNSLSGKCSSFTQLCAKLLEPAFVHRFSEYGFSERLVKCTTDNHDVLTTFLILCAYRLTCLNGASSHTCLRYFWTRVLQISHRLLSMNDDILTLAARRSIGLSKAVQGSLKKLLPQISSLIFEQDPPLRLSPCLVTLSCIQFCLTTFLEKGDEIGPLPATIINQIVKLLILQHEYPSSLLVSESFQSMELSFLILETHSMLPGTLRYDYHSSFQLLFEHHHKFLQSGQCDRDRQISIFYTRVVLNLTNNEALLCGKFATPDMVSDFVKLATASLPDAPNNRNGEDNNSFNAAILALGVLINLSEQSEVSRAAFLRPVSLLQLLIQYFSAGLVFVDQARSVSEVHYNVVIGYLSILLVILCLDGDAFTLIRESNCGEGLGLVLSTAEEFLQFHEKVERDSKLFETWREGGSRSTTHLKDILSQIRRNASL
ncbi:hypothetical protein BO94DRAFT_575671 [Aspergillus sclerotioniger CBS 115572]|uniref:Wings apart-like protein C-terminal domain-containing protein n=1 Tax=Aspergillus sclerotioniger CBS 115572 TaxID=1450535 RepID=A0A317WN56_9EURO|nr:hypothetical protein BO94DRAFT_575671 [Aspergillus sclerotioniger CBS 115572]PWY85650.1 hypothetical protein BO94DRAFT_575671 [Aspergillus sclerotioniger CBS 115572]